MARGVTTQWEDIQVQKGNWTKVDRGPTSEQIFQESVTIAEKYDYKELMTEKELEEKAEDDLFFDEDDFMKDYRAKKLAELKEDQAKPHFNGVLEINK
jgi:hypothetical protein